MSRNLWPDRAVNPVGWDRVKALSGPPSRWECVVTAWRERSRCGYCGAPWSFSRRAVWVREHQATLEGFGLLREGNAAYYLAAAGNPVEPMVWVAPECPPSVLERFWGWVRGPIARRSVCGMCGSEGGERARREVEQECHLAALEYEHEQQAAAEARCDCDHCWDPAYAAEAAMALAHIEQNDAEQAVR